VPRSVYREEENSSDTVQQIQHDNDPKYRRKIFAVWRVEVVEKARKTDDSEQMKRDDISDREG
jgi:hypothetical protein